MQLTATFSWHFVSNFLVAVLSEVLPGILPNQSYAICYNDCRSQSSCVAGVLGLPSLEEPQLIQFGTILFCLVLEDPLIYSLNRRVVT